MVTPSEMPRPGAAAAPPPGAAAGGTSDRLEAVRAELEDIGEQPIGAHVAVYERVNAVLAAELSALDEV